MNILVSLNSGYLNQLCTMLRSLSDTNKEEHIDLYVSHCSLTDEDFRKIEASLKGIEHCVHRIRLDPSLFSNAGTEKRITKETYYRLIAPDFLPSDVSRALYLDPDTIILNPLTDFYNTDFEGKLIIGAKHFTGFVDSWNRNRLFIYKSPRYINAGVILMDIKALRRNFSTDEVFRITKKKIPRLFLADQDVLNIMYDGKMKLYDERIINLDERTFSRIVKESSHEEAMSFVRDNTMIVHYDGRYKPWKTDVEYKGHLGEFYFRYNTD